MAFKGDPALYNPEDLLLMSLASCHMLSYLAMCARNRITVFSYRDEARGVMSFVKDSYQFTSVLLRPRVVIAAGLQSAVAQATALHEQAHHACFIARSVNFPCTRSPLSKLRLRQTPLKHVRECDARRGNGCCCCSSGSG